MFVYADIQLLENGVPGRVIAFPPYSFERSLEFKGNVPVTALHGKAAWRAAGGWKTRFEAGLEDLEYWISMGAAGYCGRHVAGVSLLYRRHPESRSQRMRRELKQQEMERKIKEFHSEIYQGRYPMGCCGGSKSRTVSAPKVARAPLPATPNTASFTGGGKVWVRYNGRRMAEIQVRGRTTGVYYKVERTGYEFPIWAADAPTFRRLGRGKDFTVGIPAPVVEEKPTPEPEIQEGRYSPGEPELAEIIRLDTAPPPPLAESEPIRIVQENLEAKIEKLNEADYDPPNMAAMSFEGVRGAEKVRQALTADGWTLADLTSATIEDLVVYPGVGKVAAARIIAEANSLWSG